MSKRSTLPYLEAVTEITPPGALEVIPEAPPVSPAPPEPSDRRTTSDVHGRYAFIFGVEESTGAKNAG